MSIYFITFLLTCVSTKFAESTKKKIYQIIFSFFAILIPSLLAGLRSYEIGTDVEVYILPLFQLARLSENFSDYLSAHWFYVWRYINVTDYEPGFIALIYFTTKFFDNLSIVLLVIHILIITPLYVALFRLRDYYPVWLGMLVFFLSGFNNSLNLMRQYIAMSFVLLGFSYLIKQDTKKYFYFVFIASLFHTSAIMGLLIYFIFFFINQEKKYKKMRLGKKLFNIKIFRVVFLALCFLLVLFSSNLLVFLLDTIGLEEYSNYLYGDVKFLPNQLLFRLPIFFIFIINWKKLKRKDSNIYFYWALLIMDLLFAQLASVYEQSGRIGYYFSQFSMLSYPLLITSQSRRINKVILSLFIISYLFLFWFFNFAWLGRTETVPYIFL
ncbi:EpsG family protein [Atopococcus tabaci]|uniref:EpsG family protein n=1 Tax=Atopococcus tabaci TaxID=269774 RepID=UPI0003F8EE2D|nr:EpsG family protein [Atopococcus tabaci]